MKKFLSLLLSLCLLLGTLPLQVSAFAGDIFPSESTVKTVTLNDGSLSLQNEYIHTSGFRRCRKKQKSSWEQRNLSCRMPRLTGRGRFIATYQN